MKHILRVSIAGHDPLTLFDRVSEWPEFRDAGPPFRASMGHEPVRPLDWRRIRNAHNPTGGIATWDDFSKHLEIRPTHNLVSLEIPDCFDDLADALDKILRLDFHLVAFDSAFHDEWLVSQGYRRWGFGGRHTDHGWGCLFRGAGHDRLVSRRWLDFGPWRVARLPNDTSFVQFHDLAIGDPLEAYKQAMYGHQRMGVDEIGGYIQSIDADKISRNEGVVYYVATRLLEIIIGPQIEVTQKDMQLACELRLYDQLTNQQEDPVERITYVFMSRSDAEIHLHELWLRELECWYVDEHGKHRLDLDYRPIPRPPAWVAQLDANSVNALPPG